MCERKRIPARPRTVSLQDNPGYRERNPFTASASKFMQAYVRERKKGAGRFLISLRVVPSLKPPTVLQMAPFKSIKVSKGKKKTSTPTIREFVASSAGTSTFTVYSPNPRSSKLKRTEHTHAIDRGSPPKRPRRTTDEAIERDGPQAQGKEQGTSEPASKKSQVSLLFHLPTVHRDEIIYCRPCQHISLSSFSNSKNFRNSSSHRKAIPWSRVLVHVAKVIGGRLGARSA